jgi:hypothetical protein
MAQKISPWVGSYYGWSYGEDGWNSGMDENLLKFSFLFDGNIDSITATLPAPVNGQAHYNTVDNLIYYAVGGTYYTLTAPKWFSLKLKSTGQVWTFNGVELLPVESLDELRQDVDTLEVVIDSLGTAALESAENLATVAQLDVASAQAAQYTDDAVGLVNDTIALIKTSLPISVLDYQHLIVSKSDPDDPSTWDWTPAIQAAIDASNAAKTDVQASALPQIGSRSIIQPPVLLPCAPYGNAGKSYGFYRITQSLLLYKSGESWTSINLQGSDGLGVFLAAVDGSGAVTNAFDIISGDAPAAYPGFQSSIANIHFIGGRRHINLISANINTRKITISNCGHSFCSPTEHAIHIDARSTILKIESPRVMGCPRFMWLNHVDKAVLTEPLINGNIDATTGKPADSASISINGTAADGPTRLAVQGGIFIPDPQGLTTAANTRWFDINGDSALDITDTHFGLENAGYPIVYVNTPLNSVTVAPYHSDSRVTMRNVTGGSGSSARADAGLVVLRKGVPHTIGIENVCRVGSGKLINADVMITEAGAATTLDAYLSSISGVRTPMLSVNLVNVMGWATKHIPQELQKFTSGNIPVIDPAGVFPSSSIQHASRLQGYQTQLVSADSVVSIPLPSQHGAVIVTADGDNGGASNRIGATIAVCYSSQATSVQSSAMWDTQYGDVAVADTNLTGTTGVNGNFTVSVKQGRTMQIENRLGFASRFRLLFLNTQQY